jgi:DNA-binding transcriptional LysR family regulator
MDRTHLPQLAIFAAVANFRGFRAASANLGLSPSAVSHAISELEAKLECRLFQRSTRSFALTEAGTRLLDRLGPALNEIELAIREACELDVRPRGRVRIISQLSAAEHLLAPHLASFLSAYPDITLEITTDDRFVDIVAEGYDAGIRLGENLQPDMLATRIGGQQRLILLAASSYIERYGAPQSLEELSQHKCLRRRFSTGRLYDWEFERNGEAVVLRDLPATLTSNNDRLLIEAVLEGTGIAYLLEPRVANYIAEGRLTVLLPDYSPPFAGFYLYHPSRKQMRPALRASIDFFVTKNRASDGT